MNRTSASVRPKIEILVVSCLLAGAASAAFAAVLMRLSVNGATVSTGVQVFNGRAYVPLTDVVKAMHGTLVKNGLEYKILTGAAASGGAGQVQGREGKVGDMLFDGRWRFQVLTVERVAQYNSRFTPDKNTYTPKGDTEELVVITCRLKNGMTSEETAMLSVIHPHHIALTDDHQQSYPPMDIDKRGGHTDEGPSMLPGSATDFALIFSVPKGTTLKDLVFSLQRAYADYPDGGTDVRIAVAP